MAAWGSVTVQGERTPHERGWESHLRILIVELWQIHWNGQPKQLERQEGGWKENSCSGKVVVLE